MYAQKACNHVGVTRFPSRRVKGCYVAANYKKGVLLYSFVLSRFGTCLHSIPIPRASLRLSLLPAGMKYLINSLRGYPAPRVGSRRNKSSTKFTLPSLRTLASLFLAFLFLYLSFFLLDHLSHTFGVFHNYSALFREAAKVCRQSSKVLPALPSHEMRICFLFN